MKFKLTFLLILISSFLFGQSNLKIANYYFVIKGTSNLHDWESKANEVRSNTTILLDKRGLHSIQALYLEIPVKTIKSAKGSIMDGKTYEALRADNDPNITFKLDQINKLSKSGDKYEVAASGYLNIAGTTNKIEMCVHAKVGEDGSVSFSGSKKLKMTDYKIKPPTALMGTLTTGDEVEIAFTITLK
jgi:hypothetical protein